MDQVWKRSTQKGTALLMLLAIADSANDEGKAYPSIATLARKCRMSERNAQALIQHIIESKELEVHPGQGVVNRGGWTNLYEIHVDRMPEPKSVKRSVPRNRVKSTAPGEVRSTPSDRVKPTAPGEVQRRNPLKPTSPNPLINLEDYRKEDDDEYLSIWSEVIGSPFPNADRSALQQLVAAGLTTDLWRAACRRAVASRKVRYNGDTIKRIGYVLKCLESVQAERTPVPVVAPDFAASIAANPDYCVTCGMYTFGNCEHAGRTDHAG